MRVQLYTLVPWSARANRLSIASTGARVPAIPVSSTSSSERRRRGRSGSDVLFASGSPAHTIAGSAAVATCGTLSTPGACAPRAVSNGKRHNASGAWNGHCTKAGTSASDDRCSPQRVDGGQAIVECPRCGGAIGARNALHLAAVVSALRPSARVEAQRARRERGGFVRRRAFATSPHVPWTPPCLGRRTREHDLAPSSGSP
jgi:hypothetical protein